MRDEEKIAKGVELVSGRSMYFDRKGNPLTLMEWAEGYREHHRRVALDETSNGYFISTVWLGLDHSYGSGPPLIFETMVFPRHPKRWATLRPGDSMLTSGKVDRRGSSLTCARYATEEEAMAGHLSTLAEWRVKRPHPGKRITRKKLRREARERAALFSKPWEELVAPLMLAKTTTPKENDHGNEEGDEA